MCKEAFLIVVVWGTVVLYSLIFDSCVIRYILVSCVVEYYDFIVHFDKNERSLWGKLHCTVKSI